VEAGDFVGVETEFVEHFFIVFAKSGTMLRRRFGNPMYLKRTADRRRYGVAGAFDRNDDVVRS
jgi:hypothetical protein